MLKKKRLVAWLLIFLLCVNLLPQSFNEVHASEMDSTLIVEESESEDLDNIGDSQMPEQPIVENHLVEDSSEQDLMQNDYQTEGDEAPPAPEEENDSSNILDGVEAEISLASDEPVALASSTGLSLAELRQKFPAGKYWNHAGNPGSSNSVNNQNGYTSTPCPKHKTVGTSVQTCNGFQPGSSQLSWQCMGYAEKLGYDATGYNPRNNANGWNTYTSSSALDNLKAGDIVRYKNDGHSIYVTDVNGDTVTYTDCNSDGHCIIRWGVTISKATLRSSFSYVRSAPTAQSPETVSCSCSTSYAGNYVCTTSSANLNMRSGHGTSYGIVTAIPSGAVVYVSKADGTWAHVTYNGYTGYASMQYLTKQGAIQTRKSGVRTWISNSEMGDSVDSVRTGEWAYLCYKMYDANTGDMFDSYNTVGYNVKMEIFGPSGNLEYSGEYSQDNSWISIKRSTPGTYTGKLTITFDSQYSTKVVERTFEIIYEPRIETTVSSVDLNVLGVSSQTVSISYSGATSSDSIYVTSSKTGDCFTTSWGSWSNHVIPLTITGTKAGTGSMTLYLRDSDTDEVLATKVITVSVEAPSYTVTYNANGGSGAPSSQTKDYGVSLTLSSVIPERFGYNFLGWATSSTATSANYQPKGSYGVNENATLYAIWKGPSTISSNVTNGGANAIIPYANQCRYYSFEPSFSGKVKFESLGDLDTQIYIYDASGNLLASDDDSGEETNFLLTYAVSVNTQYYIKLKHYGSGTGTISFDVTRVYDITYSANGGSGAPSAQEKLHGTPLTLSETKPTRSGYTFLGWSTSSTATSASYQSGDSYTSNGNVTLYAVWSSNGYTITYNANGGTGAPSSQAKTHGTDITLSSTIPNRFGYDFNGWSTSSTSTSATYLPGANFTTNANTTLYAVWRSPSTISSSVTSSGFSPVINFANQCRYFSFTPSFSGKVRFESSGGSDTQIYLYNADGTQLASDDDGGDNNNFLLTYAVSANTQYYIKVKYYGSSTGAISFNVTRVYDIAYDLNGAGGIIPNGQEKIHGTALTLRTTKPTRSGYTFLGWSTSSTATSASYQSGGSYTANANATLYAVWLKDSSGIENNYDISRIYGETRYETSYAIANALKEHLNVNMYDTVILANGNNFPDALAGSYLAKLKNAPILMAREKNKDSLQRYIRENLKTDGKIYVLGGTNAIPESVLNGLSGYEIQRISGKTRYETNLLILEEAGVTNEDILVCTGEEFADSLSASAAGKPILLINNKSITNDQIKFLEEHIGNKYYIIGGEAAVSNDFELLIGKYGIVERISGETRYETSVKVAQKFFKGTKEVVLAYAWNFPDGLCGGPLAMQMNAPLILTATRNINAAVSYVSEYNIIGGKILGGDSLISDDAVRKIFDLTENTEIKEM